MGIVIISTYRRTTMLYTFDTIYITADLAHYEILRAKAGKGGTDDLTEYIIA